MFSFYSTKLHILLRLIDWKQEVVSVISSTIQYFDLMVCFILFYFVGLCIIDQRKKKYQFDLDVKGCEWWLKATPVFNQLKISNSPTKKKKQTNFLTIGKPNPKFHPNWLKATDHCQIKPRQTAMSPQPLHPMHSTIKKPVVPAQKGRNFSLPRQDRKSSWNPWNHAPFCTPDHSILKFPLLTEISPFEQ